MTPRLAGQIAIVTGGARGIGLATVERFVDEGARVDIDLLGVFLGIEHAGRVMKEQRRGSIISTASIAGVVGGLGPHAYTAAKHAVIGLTKSLPTSSVRSGSAPTRSLPAARSRR